MEAALAWYDDERANIVAATRQAAAVGLHEVAWRLPPTLFPMFNRRNNWADCVTTHRVAAESASKVGDRLGEAWALNTARFRAGPACAIRRRSRTLSGRWRSGRSSATRSGEAQTAIALGEGTSGCTGRVRMRSGTCGARRTCSSRWVPISLRSVALNNLGEVYFGLGELDAAAECYLQAL